jgi:transcriptional antiterminator NusG
MTKDLEFEGKEELSAQDPEAVASTDSIQQDAPRVEKEDDMPGAEELVSDEASEGQSVETETEEMTVEEQESSAVSDGAPASEEAPEELDTEASETGDVMAVSEEAEDAPTSEEALAELDAEASEAGDVKAVSEEAEDAPAEDKAQDESHEEPDEAVADTEEMPSASPETEEAAAEIEPAAETEAQESPSPQAEAAIAVDGTEVAVGEPALEAEEDGRNWYVVHCYSGYENKVRHNLEQRIETMGMKDRIFDVVVPTEEEIEVKDGKRKTIERRVFPGYILVQMIMTEESWYVVRNTPGVTGFVGMGNEPTPLRPEEVALIIKRMEAEAPRIKVTYATGQKVRIIDGPFNDFIGTVDEIDMDRAKVRVMVSFFGRETPVELDFLQVEKA